MSVEDVMKINKMAQELLNQGIVSSRDEAVKKAQEMLSKDILPQPQGRNTDNKQSVVMNDSSIEALRNNLERMKERYESQFAAYKNALVGLEKEITDMKRVMSQLSVNNRINSANASEPRKGDAPIRAAGSNVEVPPQQEVKKEPHPRAGNFKSGDVAIEKMFYYGNK